MIIDKTRFNKLYETRDYRKSCVILIELRKFPS